MSDPNEEKNVEELLSQLQGIFGKLSRADEDEAREKKDIPLASPPASDPTLLHRETVAPLLPAEPVVVPVPEPAVSLTEDPFALQPPPNIEESSPEAFTSAPVMPVPAQPQVYDAATVGCAVYYPLMREKEAKILAGKIETMTPKFTKLTFKLKVGFILSYDPRSEWRQAAIAKLGENNIRALFLLSDRVLDEPKRRAFQRELENHLIYFQEVPILSLEKKAFFTDVLLGMVFFFDTMKPKPSGE